MFEEKLKLNLRRWMEMEPVFLGPEKRRISKKEMETKKLMMKIEKTKIDWHLQWI